jgi:hypothetical protein
MQVRLPPGEREIAYRLPSPDGASVLDRQLGFDHPDSIERVIASRRGESLAKLSLFRLLKSLVDEAQMRIECIAGRARVAAPRRLEHLSRRWRFDELDEQRLGETVGIVHPIDAKLHWREPGRNRAGGRPSLRLIRPAAKERDMRFELDRVKVCSQATDERVKRRPKRFAGDQPERELCVSDLKVSLFHVLHRVARVAGVRS